MEEMDWMKYNTSDIEVGGPPPNDVAIHAFLSGMSVCQWSAFWSLNNNYYVAFACWCEDILPHNTTSYNTTLHTTPYDTLPSGYDDRECRAASSSYAAPFTTTTTKVLDFTALGSWTLEEVMEAVIV